MFLLPPTDLLRYSLPQWRREPDFQMEDAYKWLFHATQGGDHAVQDDSGPRRWMEREWKTLDRPKPGEPRVVKLDPEGRMLRVNLRPYRASGGESEMLLAVFVASAKQFRPKKDRFVVVWRQLGDHLKQHREGNLTYPAWRRLDGQTKKLGYPAIDHSAAYERSAKPAYRVILAELWPGPR